MGQIKQTNSRGEPNKTGQIRHIKSDHSHLLVIVVFVNFRSIAGLSVTMIIGVSDLNLHMFFTCILTFQLEGCIGLATKISPAIGFTVGPLPLVAYIVSIKTVAIAHHCSDSFAFFDF